MEKFINVPVTSKGNVLVSLSNVVLVTTAADSATALTTLINYADGKVTTLTHAAQVDYSMRDAIQDAIVASYESDWKKVRRTFTAPQAISAIAVA